MAEGGTRPIAAKLYESPADSGRSTGAVYTPPGAPMSILNSSYSPHDTAESAGTRAGDPTPPVGAAVRHRVSGQQGVVVGHHVDGYSGTAQPRVQWAGEDASWPQGMSANALRIQGSRPSDLQNYGGRVGDPPSLGAGSDSPSAYTESTGAF